VVYSATNNVTRESVILQANNKSNTGAGNGTIITSKTPMIPAATMMSVWLLSASSDMALLVLTATVHSSFPVWHPTAVYDNTLCRA
jgi:hypothetical protein